MQQLILYASKTIQGDKIVFLLCYGVNIKSRYSIHRK